MIYFSGVLADGHLHLHTHIHIHIHTLTLIITVPLLKISYLHTYYTKL